MGRSAWALAMLLTAQWTAASPSLVATRLPDMRHARHGHAGVRLADGRVLIAGGSAFGLVTPVIEAELFDPEQNRFVPAGEILLPRNSPTLVATPGGGALLLGGSHLTYVRPQGLVEIWDPVARRFSRHGELAVPRSTGLWAGLDPEQA